MISLLTNIGAFSSFGFGGIRIPGWRRRGRDKGILTGETVWASKLDNVWNTPMSEYWETPMDEVKE